MTPGEKTWRRTIGPQGDDLIVGCLFCRRDDGGFTAREHVFPESLGNTELVLAPGVVCDRCNNGILSDLDQSLCEFMPIAVRRTMLGVASKSGKIPRFRASEGTVDHIPGESGADPTLAFIGSTKRGGMLRETARYPDGRVSIQWTAKGGRRMTARYASQLSRALLKSALECAWTDHGAVMLESRFDHVREAVLGESRNGFFAMSTKGNPNRTAISLTYWLQPDGNGDWRMPVLADYFGVILATDSRLPGPLQDQPAELWNVIQFSKADVR